MTDVPIKPFISVVIPTRNEESYIEGLLRSVLASRYPQHRLEVLVVDGMSDDDTREAVRRVAAEDARVHLVDNPKRITPIALNIGIGESRGDIVAIIGGHAIVAEDYLGRCVSVLQNHQDVWCAGGPVEILGENYVGRVIAGVMGSAVGVGNSQYRLGQRSGYVDTVGSPVYWRWVFDKIGLFDEELIRNQDDELNYRVRQAGGKVYIDASARYQCFARPSLGKLLRQYFQYGFWRIRTIQKHGRPASPRQLAPLALVLVWIAVLLAPLVWAPLVWVLAGFAALYGLGLLAGAADVVRKAGVREALLAPLIFIILHFGYGLGSLKGVVWFVLLRRGPASRAEDYPLSR